MIRPDFIASRAGAPFRGWFRKRMHRAAVSTMASAMLEDGDNGEWRADDSLRAQVIER